MRIQDLKPNKKARTAKRRRGRGIGSGLGKTSGKGHKGQQSRSGSKQTPGLEGGQMPLQRRIPKIGFVSVKRIKFNIVNIESLNVFKDETAVTPSVLRMKGLIRKIRCPVKVLGSGKLKKKLKVSAHAFSESAKSDIEKAGGTVEIIKT